MLGITSRTGAFMGAYLYIPYFSETSVKAAAQIAMNALLSKSTTVKFTFCLYFLQQQSESAGTSAFKNVQWILVQGQQVAVAELNYHFTIMLQNVSNQSCSCYLLDNCIRSLG
jgi:hypothetical protein